MHIRKHYYIYPPTWVPGRQPILRHSRLQARKLARRLGLDTTIVSFKYYHPASHTRWTSSPAGTYISLWANDNE